MTGAAVPQAKKAIRPSGAAHERDQRLIETPQPRLNCRHTHEKREG
jgi:hypothetical protein